MKWINQFVPNAPFQYPLRISENLQVFCCFQGVEKRYIGNKWVNEVSAYFKCSFILCTFNQKRFKARFLVFGLSNRVERLSSISGNIYEVSFAAHHKS